MKFVERNDIKKILDCTDTFLFDVDGVLKQGSDPIPGAIYFIKELRRLGKQIGFVTNASCFSLEEQRNRLRFFEPKDDEIFTPHNALISYLKKIHFQKDLFVLSNPATKNILRECGFTTIELKDITPIPIEEKMSSLIEISEKALDICTNVGAVLVDIDFEFSHVSAHIACIILRNVKDVLLLNTILDDFVPLGDDVMLIGPSYFIDGIERVGNKKRLTLGKPATPLMDALKPAYNITKPSRVMFFGDNVITDMGFGYNCGFQTCLVLTGYTTKENCNDWNYPEEYKPNYVADSLEIFLPTNN